MSDATVLTTLRDALVQQRHAGATFDEAWRAAVDDALHGATDSDDLHDWITALHATRPAWRHAYDGEPVGRRERALSLVAHGDDREPLPDRTCDHCRGAIPAGKRRQARYCSDRCRRAAGNAALNARRRKQRRMQTRRNCDIATTQRYADYAPSPAHERELVAAAFASSRSNPTASRTEQPA